MKCGVVSLSPVKRMRPTSAECFARDGENEQKLLIPEGLGQIPLWPGLGPRPHSCFDVFKCMDVPMLRKPMTYSPEYESLYHSNTKGIRRTISSETEKTSLSVACLSSAPELCSSWRDQHVTSRCTAWGHCILGTSLSQVHTASVVSVLLQAPLSLLSASPPSRFSHETDTGSSLLKNALHR